MNFRSLFVMGLLFVSLLIWGCSGDDNGVNNNEDPDITSVEGDIGPVGGSVFITDKVVLAVPAGALSETVSFSITQNNTPTSPGGTLGFLAPVYSIEPTGTAFSIPAVLTIYYDDVNVGQVGESSVVLCCDTGDGQWDTVTALVDTINNRAVASVSHLSDYAVMADTLTNITEGVYGILCVSRMKIILAEGFITITDGIVARFDSAFAPCEPVKALHPDSIECDTMNLVWESMTSQYQWGFDTYNPFVIPEYDYVFTVYGSADVPSLVDTIRFPSCEPTLSAPIYEDTVSKSGFDVTWTNVCGGVVRITLIKDNADSVLSVEVDNAAGSHTFNSAALSDLTAGEYGIVMVHQNWKNINATGYDSRSTIMARVMCISSFYLEN